MKTVNQLARATFERFAKSLSYEWMRVHLIMKGDYDLANNEDFPGNFLPGRGTTCSLCNGNHVEVSIFGWSWRSGIKEAPLFKDVKSGGFFPKKVNSEPLTLEQIIGNLFVDVPDLTHFAIYSVHTNEEQAKLELYRLATKI
jgi:hypothetical protein